MSNEGLQAAVDAMIPIADQLRQGATYCEDSFVAAKNKAKNEKAAAAKHALLLQKLAEAKKRVTAGTQ